LRNATSVTDINYRKTFANSGASLQLTYTPPSGSPNVPQNWNVIGTWADASTTITTDFLAQNSTDARVSEAKMAAKTGATYNSKTFAVSAQNADQFNAITYGWSTSCTGYGFVYVYYNHADNAACYLGIGIDDLYRVWLNGTDVADYTGTGRGAWTADGSGSATDFKGPFTLKQGWNRLLIKANNGTGGYGWSVRLANADRSYIGDCTYYFTDGTVPTNPTGCTDAGGSANNTWQNTVSDPNFTWSGLGDAQGSGEGVSGVRGYYYYFGNSAAGTSTSYVDAAAYNPSAVSSDGTYYMRVSTYDYALNAAAWATIYTFKYDATAPNAITGFGSTTPGSDDTTWYNSPGNLVWTWTAATDATSGLDGYAITQDSTATTDPGTTKNTAGTVTSYTLTGPQNTGECYLHVRSKDNAGNWLASGSTSHRRIRIDRTAPTSVSMGFGTIAKDSIAVTGAGTDAHSGVNASTGYNYSRTGASDSGGKGTSHTWTGLTANTEYPGLLVTVSDQASPTPNTAASSAQSKWTLSVAPGAGSVTPDHSTVCSGSPVTWTAVGGFGATKIQYYRYVWDQTPTHGSWTDTETQWTTGTLSTTPTAAGTWYLHVKGYNGANVGNGNYDYSVMVNALPTAPDAERVRGPGGSLKIGISGLGASASVTAVGSGTNGATITKDSTYIYYLPVTGNADTDFFTYTVTDGNVCQKSGNITVTVVREGGVARSVSVVDGKVTIDFAGIPGFQYDVQFSADGLSDWSTVTTIEAPPEGVFTYEDTSPPRSSGYYRLKQH
jgi:hypothetical protein